MFQFSGFAFLSEWHVFNMPGCPIRISTDQFVCANPRSFSQLITSFFASESHRHPPYALILLIVLSCCRLLVVSCRKNPATSNYIPATLLCFLYFSTFWILSQYVNELLSIWKFENVPIWKLIFKSVNLQIDQSIRGEYRSRTDDLLRARQAL